MAKLDPKLHLTEQELDDLLSTESRLRIATLGPGNRINLTPMTFGWAAGQVYVFARGQKVAPPLLVLWLRALDRDAD